MEQVTPMNRRLYITKHNLIKIVHTHLHQQYINQHMITHQLFLIH